MCRPLAESSAGNLCETHKPAIDLRSQNPVDLNTVPEVEQEENHET